MDIVLNWIKKHWLATIIICIALFALPLIIVHLLFKWGSGAEWKFEIAFLAAEWSAGDVLAYIAGFEAFLGTVVLGLVTVDQSQKAHKENERLSKENNFLQKISIQKLLPVVKVSAVEVGKSCVTTRLYKLEDASTATVSEKVMPEKRETHIWAYLPLLGNQFDRYMKTIKVTIANISESAIGRITVDRIEFFDRTSKEKAGTLLCCTGVKSNNHIGYLLLPGESLEVSVDIFYDNPEYKYMWEHEGKTTFGYFSMWIYLTNRSLSGIESKEKIYIEKAVGFKEKVMYKAYEEETGDA